MALLTLVMPVYNGGKYLDEAIRSVRDQTLKDIEVHILDNCSTDDSFGIASRHATEDSRLNVVRRPSNIGGYLNFEDGLSRGTCDLIAYCAHDDTRSPDYFERLVRLMRENPHAVLAAGSVNRIWPNGKTATVRGGPFRNRASLTLGAPASWFYGVWRRDYLSKRMPYVHQTFPYVGGSDFLAMFEPLIHGRVVSDPEALFYQRIPAARSYTTPDKMGLIEQLRFRSSFASFCWKDWSSLPISDRIRYALLPIQFTEKRARGAKEVVKSVIKGMMPRSRLQR